MPRIARPRAFPYVPRSPRIRALPMPRASVAAYARTMPTHRRRLLASLAALPLCAVLTAGCLAYAPAGTVGTPPPPGESGESRLPQLLSQLQSGGAGVEVFSETPEGEVLAAQAQDPGKVAPTPTPTPTATVAGDRTTPTATATPAAGNPPPATGTPTPTPRTPTPAPNEAGSTPTPTSTAAPAPTPTPTATPTPTPSPTPRPPTEGGIPTPTRPPTEG
jgi:hypothetical protein